MKFESIYGVDFSGAKLAGENIWIARIEPSGKRYALTDLNRLRSLCGTAEREPALDYLVGLIKSSESVLWGMDFPFGLPIEVMHHRATWADQLAWVASHADGAAALGTECVRRSLACGKAMHIRRTTDTEARTPFDCYHYRIIYQTFHGMRDVLLPLARHKAIAILPFQYRKLPAATRAIVEACPSSTLKRLGLPHQNYKQPAGGPLTSKRVQTRRTILESLRTRITLTPAHQRQIMRNPGGDALDAVIAALGAIEGWEAADHRAIARHPRYRFEGRLYI